MNRLRLFQRISPILLAVLVFFPICLLAPSARGETDSAEADFIPWSGWWWPTNMGGLGTGIDYNGHPAPLEKYDLLTTGQYPGDATRYYLETAYDPEAPDWYGLCQAYASAAVYEKIDFFPSSYENIIFKVGDKKGLITACHDRVILQYGESQDPAAFHLWLLHYIKAQGQAFMAELDPSSEVWNHPVYRYEMETRKSGSVMDVKCKIWYASDFVHPDYQGTYEQTNTYTYTLILSGDEIVGGEWTGDSVYDHPQQIMIPVALGPYSSYLNYELIREIAISRDDPHESDEAAELLPGGYNQVLADADSYLLNVLPGEEIHIAVESLDSISEGIMVSVLDNGRHLIRNQSVNTGERIEWSIASENPPYTLNIQRADYTETGYYRLEYDLKRVFTFYNPNVQKGYGWGGFAISNDSDTAVDTVYVTGYDRDGRPLETYVGPFALAPAEKRIVQVSDFDVRMIERDAFYGVKIHATGPIKVVSLTGYFNTNMSATDIPAEGGTLVIPDTLYGFSQTTSVSWGLYNQKGSDAEASLTHYSASGVFVDDAELTLTGHQAKNYSGANQPLGTIANGGWIRIDARNSAMIGGYIQWLAKNLTNSERLPLLAPAKQFIVPHVYSSSNWSTNLVLINTDAVSNEITIKLLDGNVLSEKIVTMAPHEKQKMSLSSLFEDIGADLLNRCGLAIAASQPLAGYYTLETSKDHLYFPLLETDSADSSLAVGHVASDGYWWTCINLFNPSDTQTANLRITAYDSQGSAIDELATIRTLAPRTKDVFDVYELWQGPAAARIASMKIDVTSGPSIVGLHAYGNMGNTMVAGIPFSRIER